MLLNFENQTGVFILYFVINLDRVVNFWDFVRRELDVDDGAEYLSDGSGSAHIFCILLKVGLEKLSLGSSGGDFENLLGDRCLAGFVIFKRKGAG